MSRYGNLVGDYKSNNLIDVFYILNAVVENAEAIFHIERDRWREVRAQTSFDTFTVGQYRYCFDLASPVTAMWLHYKGTPSPARCWLRHFYGVLRSETFDVLYLFS